MSLPKILLLSTVARINWRKSMNLRSIKVAIKNHMSKAYRWAILRNKSMLLFGVVFTVTGLLLSANTVLAVVDPYTKTNLVSDSPGLATVTDPNLVNPWGLSQSPTGPWWISDNSSGGSSIYTGSGNSVRPSITIPSPSGGAGAPTGNVFNKAAGVNPSAFSIREGTHVGSSTFLFATEDGTIAGWNGAVDNTKAIITVDRSETSDSQGDMGAVYKGLAFGAHSGRPFIYATNFRFGTIEMFDEHFSLVKSFTDPQLTAMCPAAGQCYAPFGIQNIHGKLFVTFALQQTGKHDDQAGAGNGFVDVFSTDGTLLKRLVTHGSLNSPWGLALAPRNFGMFSNDLLVGNFGDGTIHAYDIHTGALQGTLKDQMGNPVQTDGLWGLMFGNGDQAGKTNELFFTAGIGDESHGIFGKITASE